MNQEQITNIAIQIGELQRQTQTTLWTIVGFGVTILVVLIAAYFSWRRDVAQKRHEKQWFYFQKKTQIVDAAIEVSLRMMFNKLLLAYYNDVMASNNLFLLNKDALVIESQMVVYAPPELAEDFADFRETIIQTPNSEFLQKWGEIYDKGAKYLLKVRRVLGIEIDQRFEKFVKSLREIGPGQQPTQDQVGKILQADSMGAIRKLTS